MSRVWHVQKRSGDGGGQKVERYALFIPALEFLHKVVAETVDEVLTSQVACGGLDLEGALLDH